MTDENELTQQRIQNLAANFLKTQTENQGQASYRDGNLEIHLQRRPSGQYCYYAVIGGVPAAYCLGNVRKKANGRTRFVIQSSFVHPEHQRKGIGAAIYAHIINNGITLVSDWDMSEGAKCLWEKLRASLPFGTVIDFKDGYVGRKIRR